MEFRQLRYFVAVAEHLSFSKAARAAHVTQSTISHQIKQLEHELGYNLFERSIHYVRLTEQGEIFLPRIVRILRELDETIQLSKAGYMPLHERLRIIVGVYTFSTNVLPVALKQFNARFPQASVEIEEGMSTMVIGSFKAGNHDLAIGDEDPSVPFAFEPLCQEELTLVVGPDHPMAGRKRVRMIELHGEPLGLLDYSFPYRPWLDHCLEAAGAKPRVVAEFNNPNLLLRAVAQQGFGGIVTHNYPEWLNGLGLVKVYLEDPTPLRTIGLFQRKPSLSKAAQTLSDIIRNQIGDISRRQNDLGLRPC